jgi:TfoX/Sxy family transcriptional regulator of competence genes
MAYDERLAERIRGALSERADVTERKMFGGIAWMLGGNMACGIMGGDELLARLGPDGADDALDEAGTRPAVMGERTMKGYVVVAADAIASEQALRGWVDRCAAFAESLPPK